MAKNAINYIGIIPETGDSFESATQNTTGSLNGIDTKLGELNSVKLEKGGYVGDAQSLKNNIDTNLTTLNSAISARTEKGTYSGTAGQLKAMIDSLATTGTITPDLKNYMELIKNENNVKVVQGVPVGGQSTINGTGALKIKLPTRNQSDFSFKVCIGSQGSANFLEEYIIKGINYTAGFGADPTRCKVIPLNHSNSNMKNIYFCTGATEDYILIGETSTSFTLAIFKISDLFYTGAADWSTGWGISLVTTLETLDSTKKVTVTPSLDATHFDGKDSSFYPKWLGNLSNVDLNNYKYNCSFYAITGCLNTPPNDASYLLITVFGGVATCVQEGTRSGTNLKYRRTWTGIAWTAWERVLGASELTSSTLDNTIGKIAKIGDFGLGSPIQVGSATDLNTLVDSGFYAISNTTSPNKPINSLLGSLIVNNYAISRVSQLYMDISGRAWLRGSTATANNWTPWREVATDLALFAMTIKKSSTVTLDVQNDAGTSHFKINTTNRFTDIKSYISKYRGVNVASATTIAPTGEIFHVTGTTAIATITPPTGLTDCMQITIIPDGAFTTTTAGNIALATTAVVNKALTMTYDTATSKWYPSY